VRNEQVSCNVCHEPMTDGVIAVVDPHSENTMILGFFSMDCEDAAVGQGMRVEHICGEKCAHVRLSRALSPATPTPTAEEAR